MGRLNDLLLRQARLFGWLSGDAPCRYSVVDLGLLYGDILVGGLLLLLLIILSIEAEVALQHTIEA